MQLQFAGANLGVREHDHRIMVVNYKDDGCDVVCEMDTSTDHAWNDWNVRPVAELFAAAPDLLSAAIRVLNTVEAEGRDTGLGDAFSDLRDAINKVIS